MNRATAHRARNSRNSTINGHVSTPIEVQTDQDHPLAVVKEAMKALREARNFDEVKKIHDHAEAMRIYVRSAAMGLEVQNQAAELRLRAERKAGEQLIESGLHGGDRRSRSHDATLKLADLGISKQQALRWRRVAEVPDPDFEKYFRRCSELQEEITGAGLFRGTSRRRNGKASGNDAMPAKTVSKTCSHLETLIHAGKRFQCIYASPPWSDASAMRNESRLGRIDAPELRRLPVEEVAADNAHLHLFVPNELLPQAIELLPAWGFRYASTLVIRSTQPTYGRYWRDAPAFLVLGIRGKPSFGDNSIAGYVTTSPSKLSNLHELVERVSPPPCLLLFGPAGYEREGWVIVSG